MQEKILLTKEKIEDLKKELNQLIQIDRVNVIKQIQEAREQGDLSENADYDAAKNLQAEIEGKIKEIEHQINFAEIIDENDSKSNNVVKIGSTVEIIDMADKKPYTYTIVGEVESNPDENKISNLSPLAKAMLSKRVGTTVEIKGIEKPYQVKISKIIRV